MVKYGLQLFFQFFATLLPMHHSHRKVYITVTLQFATLVTEKHCRKSHECFSYSSGAYPVRQLEAARSALNCGSTILG